MMFSLQKQKYTVSDTHAYHLGDSNLPARKTYGFYGRPVYDTHYSRDLI